MADNFKYVQAQNFSLAGAGAISGATSITLKSFAGIDGALITMTDFGTIGFGTLEPGNGIFEEQISFTGVTQNSNGTATLTGVSTVLFIAPYTQTSGLAKTHAGSTTFIISNTSGFYDKFTAKADDETVTGTWIYPTNDPTRAGIGSDVDTAVATAFVTLGQLSRQAISGASNASKTVAGIVELTTQAEMDAKTTTGGTGALLVPTPDVMRSTLLSDYVADTGAADAYVITPIPAIAAYATGQIFSFKAANTNTGNSTLNVSGKGVKTIKKGDGSKNLFAADIVAGQVVVVEYDGTNFQMISGVNPTNLTPAGFIQMYGGSTAPSGWLFCDGSAVSRTTYADLFAIVSTTFGAGDTTTTFNVPDMRGRAPVGVGTGTGGGTSGTGLPTGGDALTARARAAWIGEETHVLTTPEIPSHTHTLTLNSTGSVTPGQFSASANANPVTNTTAATGGGGAHNNVQPIMTVNFIIKI